MRRIRHEVATAVPNTSFVGEVLRQNLVAKGDAQLLRVTAALMRDDAFHLRCDFGAVVAHGSVCQNEIIPASVV